MHDFLNQTVRFELKSCVHHHIPYWKKRELAFEIRASEVRWEADGTKLESVEFSSAFLNLARKELAKASGNFFLPFFGASWANFGAQFYSEIRDENINKILLCEKIHIFVRVQYIEVHVKGKLSFMSNVVVRIRIWSLFFVSSISSMKTLLSVAKTQILHTYVHAYWFLP